MRRRTFLLATAALAAPLPAQAAAARFSKGLLWRVAGRGTTSYVYGTIHVADPRLAALPVPVNDAFAAASSLTVEYVADTYGKERFLEAAMFTDGRTLEKTIGAQDFELAYQHLKRIGLTREFVNRLKPWGVLLNLRNPRGANGASLDAQLLAQARTRHLPLYMMEDVEEQVFTFDEFPMAAQVALLKHSLAHQDELIAMADRTLDAYLRRDLGAIWRIQQDFARRHPEITADNAVFLKRVIFDRSVVMAFRMQHQLRRGNAFVALGALHLYGRKGVLALLGEDGYRAKRVY